MTTVATTYANENPDAESLTIEKLKLILAAMVDREAHPLQEEFFEKLPTPEGQTIPRRARVPIRRELIEARFDEQTGLYMPKPCPHCPFRRDSTISAGNDLVEFTLESAAKHAHTCHMAQNGRLCAGQLHFGNPERQDIIQTPDEFRQRRGYVPRYFEAEMFEEREPLDVQIERVMERKKHIVSVRYAGKFF